MGFSQQVKTSINGDEYYTPQNAVDMILPYIIRRGYKNIWCPFDKEESKFVQTFKSHGLNVVYGHIETGQDFFDYSEPLGDIVVSNPPFSKRDRIFEKLYGWDIPFALIMNFIKYVSSAYEWFKVSHGLYIVNTPLNNRHNVFCNT